jgi:hypothetical protein
MASISKHIYFSKNKLYSDFEMLYNFENNLTFAKVSKAIYKDLNLEYPKYFKMDSLSKLGFLSTEVLLRNYALADNYKPEEIGIIVGNSASTYIVDSKHQASLDDKESYFPSPANFVYTLPNIMTGEICIRHKFKGENAVFISDEFDASFIFKYTKSLINDNKLKACILGYVNIDKDNYEAFLMLTEKKEAQLFDLKTLKEIYTKYKIITHG